MPEITDIQERDRLLRRIAELEEAATELCNILDREQWEGEVPTIDTAIDRLRVVLDGKE